MAEVVSFKKEVKKEFVVDNQIKGRSYSSNTGKLLKHMDRLIDRKTKE